jgi:hypothetical protein
MLFSSFNSPATAGKIHLSNLDYIFLFFNYELLVVICFFFFLIFALLAEKGQLGSYLQDISVDQRSKLSR